MSGYSRAVIWFNRIVLLAATFVMTAIAIRQLRDPIGSTAAMASYSGRRRRSRWLASASAGFRSGSPSPSADV
jgi:hypothetical protein